MRRDRYNKRRSKSWDENDKERPQVTAVIFVYVDKSNIIIYADCARQQLTWFRHVVKPFDTAMHRKASEC